MLDLVCYDAMVQYVKAAKAPFVRMDIAATANDADGNYVHETNTIIIHPRVCQKPRFFLKWVVLHELGHSVAVKHGDMSEEGADSYNKKWYGDASALLTYVSEECNKGSNYYCYVTQVMK